MGKEVEVLYYPSSEHKEADLRLCFRICKTLVFSRGGSFTAIVITLIIHTGISNGEIYDRACVKMIIQKKGCLCLQKQTFKYLCLRAYTNNDSAHNVRAYERKPLGMCRKVL